MNNSVIKATIDMCDKLGYIQAVSWQQAYTGIIEDGFLAEFTPAKRTIAFENSFNERTQEGYEYYLFKFNNAFIGMAIIGKARDEDLLEKHGEVCAFYFLPSSWGKGHAKPAMKFCLNRLKELEYNDIVLWVLRKNVRACQFYAKFGFKNDGTEKQIILGSPLTVNRYVVNLSSVD